MVRIWPDAQKHFKNPGESSAAWVNVSFVPDLSELRISLSCMFAAYQASKCFFTSMISCMSFHRADMFSVADSLGTMCCHHSETCFSCCEGSVCSIKSCKRVHLYPLKELLQILFVSLRCDTSLFTLFFYGFSPACSESGFGLASACKILF